MLLTENTEPSELRIGVKSKAIKKVSAESHVNAHKEVDQKHR